MRLIDADALIEDVDGDLTDSIAEGRAIEKIMNAPTIEERKTGKWQWLSSTYDRTPCEMRYMCSECHHETILHSNETSRPWENFCPNCGADMRGREDE